MYPTLNGQDGHLCQFSWHSAVTPVGQVSLLISNHFHSQKCPSLADKLCSHPIDGSILGLPPSSDSCFPLCDLSWSGLESWTGKCSFLLALQAFNNTRLIQAQSQVFQESYIKYIQDYFLKIKDLWMFLLRKRKKKRQRKTFHLLVTLYSTKLK